MTSTDAAPARPRMSFAAMRYPQYRWYFFTFISSMMADNIEHVISYWIMFQKFHSAALGGFAVVSHWVPFLVLAIPIGGLADRFDPRRLIQFGMCLFIGVSLGWGYFFLTDTLTMGAAMTLLVIHGCAGVFWGTSNQMLIHELVPRHDLPSAVRLNASARYLGVLVGPALGGAMLLGLGPTKGIFLNAFYYLPLILWMQWAPFRQGKAYAPNSAGRAVRSFADAMRSVGDAMRDPALLTMLCLAASAAFLIGNSYQAQMPNFAHDLGHGDPGAAYSMLLAADATGALTAAILLETVAMLPTRPLTALLLALGWGVALAGFALSKAYPMAIACLFAAGFCELSFNSIAQTVVQLRAPPAIRGRVIGTFNMAAMGSRAFSGISVGIVGALVGVHISLAIAAGMVVFVVGLLLVRELRRPAAAVLP